MVIHRALAPLLVLVLSLGLSAPLTADYKKSYGDGIRNGLDRKDWSLLAEKMRQAIAEQPQSSKKRIKLYGNRLTPYLPHYYLGLALYELGDTDGALAEWEIAQAQGSIEVLKKNDRKELEERLDELNTRLASQPSPPATVDAPPEVATSETADPAALAAAKAAADSLLAAAEAQEVETDRLANDPLLRSVWADEQSLGPATSRAKQRLQRARQAIEAGESNQDVAALTTAGREAEEARKSLAAVHQQGLDRKATLVADQQAESRETELAAREAEVAGARAAAELELEQARSSLDGLSASAADPDLATVWNTDESLGGRQSKASDLIDNAQSFLRQGASEGDLDALAQSRTLAGEARRELAAISRTATARKEEIMSARQEKEARERREAEAALASSAERIAAIRDHIQKLDTRAGQALDRTGKTASSPALDTLATTLRESRQAASRLPTDADVTRFERARSDLDTALNALEKGLMAASLSTVAAPADLLAAAEAYFSADYQRTSDLLSQASYEDPKATLQARLFRAAARYALFLIGGESDDELREGSRTDIRDLREIDPAFEPEARAFSPRFTRFFAETAAAL